MGSRRGKDEDCIRRDESAGFSRKRKDTISRCCSFNRGILTIVAAPIRGSTKIAGETRDRQISEGIFQSFGDKVGRADLEARARRVTERTESIQAELVFVDAKQRLHTTQEYTPRRHRVLPPRADSGTIVP